MGLLTKRPKSTGTLDAYTRRALKILGETPSTYLKKRRGSTGLLTVSTPTTQTPSGALVAQTVNLKPGQVNYGYDVLFEKSQLLGSWVDETAHWDDAWNYLMGMQPETRFKERVQRDIKKLPKTWVIKTQERGRRGVPDLLLCVNGFFVALELKVNDGQLEALQEHVIEQIEQAGGIAYEVRPETWERIYEHLKNIAE